MIIAIDGPAGSGKSTVAKAVAQRLGMRYLDTGAMYRAIAIAALSGGIPTDDEDALAAIALDERIRFEQEPGDALPRRVLLGDEDVTEAIRTPEADAAVSAVSRLPRVREAMVAQQRAFAAGHDVVAEGRDIGTVVFPEAELKIFLTASPEERAQRRTAQHSAGGHDVAHAETLDAIRARDHADSTRSVSPLTPAKDAVEIDTTGLGIEEVVDRVAELAAEAR